MYIAIKDKSVEIVHSMDASGRQSYDRCTLAESPRAFLCSSCCKVCRKRLLNATATRPELFEIRLLSESSIAIDSLPKLSDL